MSDTPVPAGYPCSVHPVFDGTGWYCPVHHRMASVCIDEARAVPVEGDRERPEWFPDDAGELRFLTPDEGAALIDAARRVRAGVSLTGSGLREALDAALVGMVRTSYPMPRNAYEKGWNEAIHAARKKVTALADWSHEDWAEMRGGDPIARTINAVHDDLAALSGESGEPTKENP